MKDYLNLFHITLKLNPFPCIFVNDKIFPPGIHFKIFVVAWTTAGFFDFAARAMPKIGAVALIAGFKNLFQAACVTLVIFCNLFLSVAPQAEILQE